MLSARGLHLDASKKMNLISKIKSAETASGYIVKKHYISKLIDCFENSLLHMNLEMKSLHNKINTPKKPRITVSDYALDQYWKTLQLNDSWYICNPVLGEQNSSDSNIQVKNLDKKLNMDNYTFQMHTNIDIKNMDVVHRHFVYNINDIEYCKQLCVEFDFTAFTVYGHTVYFQNKVCKINEDTQLKENCTLYINIKHM